MFKALKFSHIKIISFLFICTSLFYFPVLLDPSLILFRDNDLQQFFWPIFYYTKQHLLSDYSLPLWNNIFLSGVPLLPDPQSFLFYLPNIIFLIFPIDAAFIISFIFHTLIGGIGTYLCAKYGFKLKTISSLFIASLYIMSPKVASYLEAGHFGLVASFTYLPFLLLAIILIIKKQRFIYAFILAISLAGIFYTHTIIFILSLFATIIVFVITFILYYPKKNRVRICLIFAAAIFLTFGLIAITLLPQIEWTSETTRFILLENRDTYPKWISKKEFLEISIFPYLQGRKYLSNIDNEKWLSMGSILLILASIGFWKIKRKLQIILGLSIIFLIIIALNNASPFYSYLIKIDWYALIRVSTRIWFIIIFIFIFLAGFGFEFLLKTKINRKILLLIVSLTLIELLFLSWLRLLKPTSQPSKYISRDFYNFIKQDKEYFRVFCLNRCIPQQQAAKENLQLVEGYNTLLQKNYYQHMWQLSGRYWNYYTLALPPIGTYTFEKLQPNAQSLGAYNTKYIISLYKLDDKNFIFEKKFDNYFLYRNKLFLSRAYFKNMNGTKNMEAPILIYQPNLIRVDTSNQLSKQLILAEVYSKGWKAYLNGKEQVPILETPSSLRLVNIKSNTMFVEFKYMPDSFKIGVLITISTILIMITILLLNLRKIFRHTYKPI